MTLTDIVVHNLTPEPKQRTYFDDNPRCRGSGHNRRHLHRSTKPRHFLFPSKIRDAEFVLHGPSSVRNQTSCFYGR
jgi:hypothetical protein